MQLPPSQIPPPDPNAVVLPNLDSAVINVDPVEGAKDYRAFVVHDGVEILVDDDGYEVVNGATIYCAGQRQVAAKAPPVPEVMTQIEVFDVTEPTEFVVEAIDRLCPFAGVFGTQDEAIEITSPDAITASPHLVVPLPLVTEDTIRDTYGSMIFNGHGPAAQPGFPAEPVIPKVLKRWTVQVEPLTGEAAEQRRTADFFADFSEDDPFVKIPPGPNDSKNDDGTFHAPEGFGFSYSMYENSQFVAYTTNTETISGDNFFLDRGVLQTILPDQDQDVMGALVAVPKQVAHLPNSEDDGYLHITFEGSTNSTGRRYWWLSVCGPENEGETFTEDGHLTEIISLAPGFWNPDSQNPSVGAWNCLIVFPHDGLQVNIPNPDTPYPQSSIIVVQHKANMPRQQTAVNVSPQQVNDGFPPAWYKMMEDGRVLEKGVLDDLIQVAPRAHFDFYISRSRVVMYVNGEQRLCNDFGEGNDLTMAEASVGFNNALYHSSAEHTEMQVDFADRTGQFYYLQNSIFLDMHAWDNLGFEENVGLPDSFEEQCYTYQP